MRDPRKWNLAALEQAAGKRFGDPNDPLLLAVRVGGNGSPMDDQGGVVLNVGLNDSSVQALARLSDERVAFDCYRQLIHRFGMAIKGIAHERFERELLSLKRTRGIVNDVEMTDDDWEECVRRYKTVYRAGAGEDFPQDPFKQFEMAVGAGLKPRAGRRPSRRQRAKPS
jgi:pyruvate,orthophosphate dikinase